MPAGRPTKYKASMIDLISKMGNHGESMAEFAVSLDISKDTLYEWMHDKKEFSDAIKAARLRSQVWWESTAKTQAKEGGGNAAALLFQIKNRFADDYRDKQETELSTKGDKPIVMFGGNAPSK